MPGFFFFFFLSFIKNYFLFFKEHYTKKIYCEITPETCFFFSLRKDVHPRRRESRLGPNPCCLFGVVVREGPLGPSETKPQSSEYRPCSSLKATALGGKGGRVF